jgi:hypothetical protein
MAGNPCGETLGIKNIVLSFYNCVTGVRYTNLQHVLASDKLPMINRTKRRYEALPGGGNKLKMHYCEIKDLNVKILPGMDLTAYQGGDWVISGQIEYFSGKIYTWENAKHVGSEGSDTREANLDLVPDGEIDELFASGTRLAA